MLKIGIPDSTFKRVNVQLGNYLKDFEKKGLSDGEVEVKNVPLEIIEFPDGYSYTDKYSTMDGVDYLFDKLLDNGNESIYVYISTITNDPVIKLKVERRFL